VARRRSVAGTNPRGPRRVNPSASGPGSPVWDTVAHCRWGHAGCFRILRGMCRDPSFQRDGDLRNHNTPRRDTVGPGTMQKSTIPYWASLASLHWNFATVPHPDTSMTWPRTLLSTSQPA
jgi:hypothetical protein